jgi:hypothetical protein
MMDDGPPDRHLGRVGVGSVVELHTGSATDAPIPSSGLLEVLLAQCVEFGLATGELTGESSLPSGGSHQMVEAIAGTTFPLLQATRHRSPLTVHPPLGGLEPPSRTQLCAAGPRGTAVSLLERLLALREAALMAGWPRPGHHGVGLTGPDASPGEPLVVVADGLSDSVGEEDHTSARQIRTETLTEEPREELCDQPLSDHTRRTSMMADERVPARRPSTKATTRRTRPTPAPTARS